MDVFSLFAKIGLDTSEYEKGLDDASGKTHSFGEKLKSGLTTAAKVGVAAIGAASTAIGALTKQSIEGYAEYEQLVGGVETLFKDSSDVVMEYANNAYKTAGLSANQYMETVTSFSASLLQSLDGDTQKAASVADMAITDMADNANKMGTSIEMIQNAYQGFAKQNYTMLDNLKLGYGGTKEEMQRLLEDAEKLSGQKFDLSSYADIVDAIHVVQTEMGITGTTAKEASSTIQGSVNAAKSAWKNLVVGISDDNQNLDTLINNFVDSVATAGENILPRVEIILSRMGSLVQSLAPIIAQEIPSIVSNVLPSLLEAGASLLYGLINGIITSLPSLISTATEIIVTLSSGISESLPELIPTIVNIIIQIVETLIDNVDMLVDAAIEIILALADGLINTLPTLIEKAPEIVLKLVEAIIENAPKLLDAAVELIGMLASGILDQFIDISKKIDSWLYDNIVQPIIDKISDFRDAGSQLLEGLWNGISDKVEWLKGKVKGVVDTIKGWFTGKDGFDEHSPSKWANQVFRYVMEGGGQGLEAGLSGLMNDVSSVVETVKNGLEFGTAQVDFAASGLGISSAGIVNGINSVRDAGNFSAPITLNLVFPDGTKLASYLFDPLAQFANANGTPILNPT